MISYWSTSPKLSDRGSYPFFFRTIPDDSKIAIAVADFYKEVAKHEHVAVLYVADPYGQAYAEAFLSAGAQKGINVKPFSFAFQDKIGIKKAVENIAAQGLKSTFVIAFDDDFPEIMKRADENALLDEDSVWATVDAVSGDGFGMVENKLHSKLHGFVRMFALGGNEVNDGWVQLTKRWEEGTAAEHNALGMPTDFSITDGLNNVEGLNDVAAYAYDAVIMA